MSELFGEGEKDLTWLDTNTTEWLSHFMFFISQNVVSILISQYLYKGHFPLIVKNTYA